VEYFTEVSLNKPTSLPFGLRFAERPTANNFIVPAYDEDEDLSVVIDEKGRKISSVEYYGNLGTSTATKTQEEITDEDHDSFKLGGTKTFTHVNEEVSDSDDNHFSLILGTKTGSAVQSEQSDEDPSVDNTPKSPVTTKTFTNVVREETDSDQDS
jgi:hypothetical protein